MIRHHAPCRVLAVAAALVLAVATGAAAQQVPDLPPSSTPFQGLFAPQPGTNAQPQTLTLTVNTLGAYDSDLGAGAFGLAPDPRVQIKGAYSTATGTLQYTRHSERGDFAVSGSSMGRYLPGQASSGVTSEWGTLSISRRLSDRTQISLGGYGIEEPYYQLTMFGISPSQVAPAPLLDYSVLWRPAMSYGANANLSHQTSERTSVDLLSSFNRTQATVTGEWLLEYSAGANFSYRHSRYTSYHVGYLRQQMSSLLLNQQPMLIDNQIDVGLDYNRPLGADQRVQFGFSTSTTALSANQAIGGRRQTQFSVLGSAFLIRDIGQTWSARLNYARSLQILQITGQSFFVDSGTATVGGYLGRRLNVSFASSDSNAAFTTGGYGYSTWNASASGRFALTRALAIYAQYFFYHYDFSGAVTIPEGLSRRLNRQGVRVGLTWFLSFIH